MAAVTMSYPVVKERLLNHVGTKSTFLPLRRPFIAIALWDDFLGTILSSLVERYNKLNDELRATCEMPELTKERSRLRNIYISISHGT